MGGVDESVLDSLPRPNKRNQFKSIHKQRKQRGLDEVDAQNFVGGMTAGYQRRENQPVSEGPFVQRIMHPGKVSIYVRSGKVPKLVATDIPYEILDRYIAKVIAKYPQFKPSDFSFRSSDKVSENQGWAATYEALKPDAFAALQQAKQNIEQNRQQEVDQWEQDFRANSAKLARQQLKQRFAEPPPEPPTMPVVQPGESPAALRDKLAQLNIAKQKFEEINALIKAIKKKYQHSAIEAEINAIERRLETGLLPDVRAGVADNYKSLLAKLDNLKTSLTTRFIVKEAPDYIDEYNKQ
jgi:hypothetical protein